MPVNTELLHDDRVLVLTYTDPLMNSDVLSGINAYQDTYAKATRPLHSINDVTQVTRMPPNLLSLIARTQDSPFRHSMAGIFVVVTNSPFVLTLASATARLIPRSKIRAVETLESAWAEINEVLAAEDTPVKLSDS
jgi:hypothetical protein